MALLITAPLLAGACSLILSATAVPDDIPGWLLMAAVVGMLVGYLVLAVGSVRQARKDGKPIRATFRELLAETGRFIRDLMPV